MLNIIECQIQLMYFYFDKKHQKTYAGAKFTALSAEQQTQIDQRITEIQLKFYHRYLEDGE